MLDISHGLLRLYLPCVIGNDALGQRIDGLQGRTNGVNGHANRDGPIAWQQHCTHWPRQRQQRQIAQFVHRNHLRHLFSTGMVNHHHL